MSGGVYPRSLVVFRRARWPDRHAEEGARTHLEPENDPDYRGYLFYEGDEAEFDEWAKEQMTEYSANTLLEVGWEEPPDFFEEESLAAYPGFDFVVDWRVHYEPESEELRKGLFRARSETAQRCYPGRIDLRGDLEAQIAPLHLKLDAITNRHVIHRLGDPGRAAFDSSPYAFPRQWAKQLSFFYRIPQDAANASRSLEGSSGSAT